MSHGRRSFSGRKGGMVAERIKAPYRRHGREDGSERLFLEEDVCRWRERLEPHPHLPPRLNRFRINRTAWEAERLQVRLLDLLRSLPRILGPAQRARLARRRGRRR
jgi:hypothetical protein